MPRGDSGSSKRSRETDRREESSDSSGSRRRQVASLKYDGYSKETQSAYSSDPVPLDLELRLGPSMEQTERVPISEAGASSQPGRDVETSTDPLEQKFGEKSNEELLDLLIQHLHDFQGPILYNQTIRAYVQSKSDFFTIAEYNELKCKNNSFNALDMKEKKRISYSIRATYCIDAHDKKKRSKAHWTPQL